MSRKRFEAMSTLPGHDLVVIRDHQTRQYRLAAGRDMDAHGLDGAYERGLSLGLVEHLVATAVGGVPGTRGLEDGASDALMAAK